MDENLSPDSLETENKKETMISKPNDGNGQSAFGASLPDVSDTVVKDLVKVFKLLSDETRLRILLYLTRTDELHVRALCDILQQSQPAVSHHLALLRVAELIESRREGKHNYYRVLPQRFQDLLDMVFAAVPSDERRIRFEDYVLSYAPADELVSQSV